MGWRDFQYPTPADNMDKMDFIPEKESFNPYNPFNPLEDDYKNSPMLLPEANSLIEGFLERIREIWPEYELSAYWEEKIEKAVSMEDRDLLLTILIRLEYIEFNRVIGIEEK